MPCYRPVTVWKPDDGGAVSFREVKNARELQIKCSKCIGCRIELQEAWAFRCYAESKMHASNAFITLTYDDQHLPARGSLTHRDWQLFAKRLRRRAGPFRFFMCGEYGENFGRPHFHALLFGLDFPDRVKCNSLYARGDLFQSDLLSDCWGKGFASLGEVTYASARYCAAYTVKRLDGPKAEEQLTRLDPYTGELYQLQGPYGRMSLKPGIGAEWIRKYWPEVAVHGAVHVGNRKRRVPRYFDELFEQIAPDDFEASKHSRTTEAIKFIDNNTRDRLEVREACARAKSKFNKERYSNAL